MLQRFLLTAFVGLLALPVAAQAPDGWMVRVDRSENAQDPDDTENLSFMTMGGGFHVTGGPAGTFWNDANTPSGDFTLSGSFGLMKPSGHTNYYGLIFGGSNLGAANQTYIYFLVGQNGNYMVKHRAGDEVHDVQASTAHASVNQPGADGRSTNDLEVRVAGNTISYVVNGQVVHTTPKSGMTAMTDGLAGIRINHQLDVHVGNFEIQ
ncbi:MAG: hypothetical protein ABGY72_24890 [bacterium]